MDINSCFFYCLLFSLRALKKWKSRWEGGSLTSETPGRSGTLEVWEIHLEEEEWGGGGCQKFLPSVRSIAIKMGTNYSNVLD